jgi:hypothetical protein
MLARHLRRIDADGHDLHAARFELLELIFETP